MAGGALSGARETGSCHRTHWDPLRSARQERGSPSAPWPGCPFLPSCLQCHGPRFWGPQTPGLTRTPLSLALKAFRSSRNCTGFPAVLLEDITHLRFSASVATDAIYHTDLSWFCFSREPGPAPGLHSGPCRDSSHSQGTAQLPDSHDEAQKGSPPEDKKEERGPREERTSRGWQGHIGPDPKSSGPQG